MGSAVAQPHARRERTRGQSGRDGAGKAWAPLAALQEEASKRWLQASENATLPQNSPPGTGTAVASWTRRSGQNRASLLQRRGRNGKSVGIKRGEQPWFQQAAAAVPMGRHTRRCSAGPQQSGQYRTVAAQVAGHVAAEVALAQVVRHTLPAEDG